MIIHEEIIIQSKRYAYFLKFTLLHSLVINSKLETLKILYANMPLEEKLIMLKKNKKTEWKNGISRENYFKDNSYKYRI